MTRILAVSDEVEDSLYGADLKAMGLDLIVSCGDLPFDYLEGLVTLANVPLMYVPGNHDPDLRHRPQEVSPEDILKPISFGRNEGDTPGPEGCLNIDGRVTDAAGMRIAGLGGSMRYTQGPNQYTQSEMTRRAIALEARARLGSLMTRRSKPARHLEVLLTHSPPLGVGDDDDPCHEGFAAFHRLVERLSPSVLLHGHIHPYGRQVEELQIDETRIINTVGHRLIEV
ncbi:MAG: metallophosphoesterase family protein [Actinomycetota bacterium]